MTTATTFRSAIQVQRSDTGCYQFAARKNQAWASVTESSWAVEVIEPLQGWGEWTHAVKVCYGGDWVHFFAK